MEEVGLNYGNDEPDRLETMEYCPIAARDIEVLAAAPYGGKIVGRVRTQRCPAAAIEMEDRSILTKGKDVRGTRAPHVGEPVRGA